MGSDQVPILKDILLKPHPCLYLECTKRLTDNCTNFKCLSQIKNQISRLMINKLHFFLYIYEKTVLLNLMLLAANLANTKICKKPEKITETLANGYSSESTQRELSNEYQDDRVSMFFQESCILVLWTKVVSALEGLTTSVSKSNISSELLQSHVDQNRASVNSRKYRTLLINYNFR